MNQHLPFFSTLALQDALKLSREMLEHLPVGIALFDPELRVLSINRLAILEADPNAFIFIQSIKEVTGGIIKRKVKH